MKSLAYNFWVASFGRIVVNAIGFVVVALLARNLGPEKFGDYNIVFAYLFFFQTIADMGLYTLLTREISRENSDEKHIASSIFTLRLWLIVILSAIAILLSFALPYSSSVRYGIAIGSLYIIFSSLVQVLMGVFQKHLKICIVTIADAMMRCVQLAMVAILIFYGARNISAFIFAAVLGALTQFLVVAVNASKISGFTIMHDVDFWKKTMKDALPIAASLVFVLLYFKIDTLMLSFMRPSFEVGVYSIGYKVLEIIIFFPAMYIGLIMPLMSKSVDNVAEFKKIYKKAFEILSVWAFLAMAGVFIFSGLIVSILGGSEYADSALVLKILSIAIAVIFLGNLGGNAIIALNLQKKAVWIYGIGAVFNIVTNYIYIPEYGYFGASWTTVATEILVTVGMFWIIQKELAYKAARL